MTFLNRQLPVLAALVAFTLPAAAVRGAAPENLRDTTITDPAQAGLDFELQGEYLDRVRLTTGGTSYMGLQVVALGGGRFQAVLYWGGLPGAGWDRSRKEELAGEAQGDAARLQGVQHAVTIRDQVATLEDSGGSLLGRMNKIHRVSPTQGQAPPPGARVLFDGAPTDQLQDAKLTDDGLLAVGATTKTPVQDFRLHLEFRTPFMPYALGQRRGNSGVYIQRRYEVQILDSFGLEGKPNECGGLYRQTPPDVNMCLPPLSWQTYDIEFTAARFDAEGNKIRNARLTVYHNGVPIHQDRELTSKTGAGRPEAPQALPIHFQNHGNPVAFRNVWLVLRSPLELAAVSPAQPVEAAGPAPVGTGVCEPAVHRVAPAARFCPPSRHRGWCPPSHGARPRWWR